MKTRIIPFDLAKAKAGAKVITRNGNPVRITCYYGEWEEPPLFEDELEMT